jgi:hypothetical protein
MFVNENETAPASHAASWLTIAAKVIVATSLDECILIETTNAATFSHGAGAMFATEIVHVIAHFFG